MSLEVPDTGVSKAARLPAVRIRLVPENNPPAFAIGAMPNRFAPKRSVFSVRRSTLLRVKDTLSPGCRKGRDALPPVSGNGELAASAESCQVSWGSCSMPGLLLVVLLLVLLVWITSVRSWKLTRKRTGSMPSESAGARFARVN